MSITAGVNRRTRRRNTSPGYVLLRWWQHGGYRDFAPFGASDKKLRVFVTFVVKNHAFCTRIAVLSTKTDRGRFNVSSGAIVVYPDLINVHPGAINVDPDLFNVHPGAINVHPGAIVVHPDLFNVHPGAINVVPTVPVIPAKMTANPTKTGKTEQMNRKRVSRAQTPHRGRTA